MPKKSQTKGQLAKKLDKIFSRYIRLRDSDHQGYIMCITCSKKVHRKKAHAAHRIPRGNYIFRRSEWNVNASCNYCNTYDVDHQRKYTMRMIERKGLDRVKDKEGKKRTIKDYKIHEIRDMIEHYKAETKKLEEVKPT